MAPDEAKPKAKNAGKTPEARLAALRAELKRMDLDGFIQPRGDEHQGEYVAERSERLAWLTGFTGSAGLAVVLRDKAAVFIDGRYTLQAETEVPASLFEYCHLTERPPHDWIADNIREGAKLGYDPWLLTPVQVARYKDACKKAGAMLTAVPENPVDGAWTDQPPPPMAPVVVHDIAFTGKASADKRREIGESLAELKLDAAVLTAPDSIAWLLNIRGADVPFSPLALGFAILAADGGCDLFMAGEKLIPKTRDHLSAEVSCHETDQFEAALAALGEAKKTVRVNPESVPAWVFDRLEESGAVIDRGTDPCQLPKAKKNPVEIEGFKAAHRRDGASLTRFLAWLAAETPNGQVTEMAACDKLEQLRRDNDHYRGLSFPTISGAGPNGAIVHYRVTPQTDRTLDDGMLYLVDSGAQYLDATTDVTRTVAIGAPNNAMREHFTLVLKGHIAIAIARFPEGTRGSQLDSLARRALWAEGLDYDHGTGHGVGSFLGVHEGPQRISKTHDRIALEPGMVVSNEPGYYKTGAYGIRIENLVTVVNVDGGDGAEKPLLGFETLTLAPLDRALIDKSKLSQDEIAWVDAYHARVMSEIGLLVDEITAKWLKGATRPL